MILAWICFYDAIIAVIAIAAGIAAAHFELIAPYSGFEIMLAGLAFAALGVVAGLIAVPMTLFSAKRRPARGRALISTFVCVALLIPIIMVLWQTYQYPLINDVTTDTDHPPVFITAIDLQPQPGRDMTYNPQVAAIQKAAPAYADLAPLKMAGPPDEVFAKAAILAGRIRTWQITRIDPGYAGFATTSLSKCGPPTAAAASSRCARSRATAKAISAPTTIAS